MATKPRFRIRSAALAATATATCLLATASPTLADTGGVYFDNDDNAAAGDPAHLFNGTFTGTFNTGLGRSVMPNLTTGNSNVAAGVNALSSNTSGNNNVAAGVDSLEANTTGTDNVATGWTTLLSNTTGAFNIAAGTETMFNNTTGNSNVATGAFALHDTTTGSSNVAAGPGALAFNTTGSRNVGLGQNAGKNLTTGSDNVDIANAGKAGEAGTIRIGNDGKQTTTFIAGIGATTLSGAAQPVLVKANGQLGIAPGASAKSSAARPLSATAGKRLLATVKHQQRQIARLQREVRRRG